MGKKKIPWESFDPINNKAHSDVMVRLGLEYGNDQADLIENYIGFIKTPSLYAFSSEYEAVLKTILALGVTPRQIDNFLNTIIDRFPIEPKNFKYINPWKLIHLIPALVGGHLYWHQVDHVWEVDTTNPID